MTTYRLTDSLDEAQRAQDAGVDVWCLLEPNAVAYTAGTTSTRLPCCNEHVAVWTCRSSLPAGSSMAVACCRVRARRRRRVDGDSLHLLDCVSVSRCVPE